MTLDPRLADVVQAGGIRLGMFLPQYAKDAATGELRGLGPGVVMLKIAHALAARAAVALSVVELRTPRSALDCVKDGGCEFAFLGIEPSRAAEVDFTPAVFQFDYSLLVPAGSFLRNLADIDRAGTRVTVVRNHPTQPISIMVDHATSH